jgi:hypothetical protein
MQRKRLEQPHVAGSATTPTKDTHIKEQCIMMMMMIKEQCSSPPLSKCMETNRWCAKPHTDCKDASCFS